MYLRKKNNLLGEQVIWHSHVIKKNAREYLHKHRAMLLWFTGLSGSGKSTIAGVLEEELYSRSISTYLLDGDNIRHGLCYDLGFTNFDRHENLRRVGEVAALMVDAGLVVLASFVSPYCFDRQMVRSMVPVGSFVEIFVDTPLSICKARDPKGLYRMSDDGMIENFVGVHAVYERPVFPEIYLDGRKSVKYLIKQLLEALICRIVVSGGV
ncbi:adenylyl-sulfate kinase [Blochmannia endosymbiont of Polyrhachis (Hedomyrma) turneri]|uniref:adenylyl-sulfate kinase n=1 Tax=Blochmannia endosymbiont of Polyrhachis (Hedomyrma) turneri TaxID=1505596 RepID=UPI00061A53E1|nr:adenylyl-sulfate kinase [Blochmannia endosymbiont of Polyrhachis (Hedomyrma) turneri]AKC59748.1 adenylyl-sulfate kinase [Blochmannia endosymbiont of Polyrhachis (Hedomyrma) turneri]